MMPDYEAGSMNPSERERECWVDCPWVTFNLKKFQQRWTSLPARNESPLVFPVLDWGAARERCDLGPNEAMDSRRQHLGPWVN